MWYVYILRCSGGAYYTGITQDLKKRFQEHVIGRGAFFTSHHHPEEIVYFEVTATEFLAKQRESQIKRWSRAKKQALINGNLQKLRELSISRD